MPTYDFKCGSGHVTERKVPMVQTTIRCACGKRAQRQFPAPAVRFMGDGFTGAGKAARTR